MPHVVLKGQADLEGLAAQLEPTMDRTGDDLVKTTRIYTAQDGTRILLEALTIEDGAQQPFFAAVDRRDDGLVVRLHEASTGIDKTDGVKRLLALVAKQLIEIEPGLSIGETNLETYLVD